jgi:hypothetical protein
MVGPGRSQSPPVTGWLVIISLHGIRAAVMRDLLSKRNSGRDWNATLASTMRFKTAATSEEEGGICQYL